MSKHSEDCNWKGNKQINILLRSNLGQLVDMKIQRRLLQIKEVASLHYRSEAWGYAKTKKYDLVQQTDLKKKLEPKEFVWLRNTTCIGFYIAVSF